MSAKRSLAIALVVSSNAASVATALAADWNGPYIGIAGGGGWGNQGQHTSFLAPTGGGSSTSTGSPTTTISSSPPPTDGSYHLSGGLVGGVVGYNWQFSNFVFGLEGDGSWADISGSGTCGDSTDFHACGGGVDALGTVRGRIGFDPGAGFNLFQGILLYATGGLAVGDVHGWDSFYDTSGHHLEAGWTVGAGIETKLTPNWSVKVEYLYTDLGDPTVFSADGVYPERLRTDFNTVRVGVNYYFDTPPPPPPPVVAKY